jgi:hypothetical protein
MRRAHVISAILLAAAVHASPVDQDSTGLPGDHFSLQGALDLFKRSKSLESFEKALNDKDSKVNNLDLDQDGKTDYIRVVDHAEGTSHAIVLQVPVNKTESQDVAVIELEKKGTNEAAVQIRGDEDLYGKKMIIQPKQEEKQGKGSKGGGPLSPAAPDFFYVNVWYWPCVEWIYGPSYVVWVSPWYWGYYPPWWHPWHCYHWHTWYGWQQGFYYDRWYEPTTVVYVEHAHAIYAPRRVHSPTVVQRVERERIAAPRPKGTSDRNTLRDGTDVKRDAQMQRGSENDVQRKVPRERDEQRVTPRDQPNEPGKVKPAPAREKPMRPTRERKPEPAPRVQPQRERPAPARPAPRPTRPSPRQPR